MLQLSVIDGDAFNPSAPEPLATIVELHTSDEVRTTAIAAVAALDRTVSAAAVVAHEYCCLLTSACDAKHQRLPLFAGHTVGQR